MRLMNLRLELINHERFTKLFHKLLYDQSWCLTLTDFKLQLFFYRIKQIFHFFV